MQFCPDFSTEAKHKTLREQWPGYKGYRPEQHRLTTSDELLKFLGGPLLADALIAIERLDEQRDGPWVDCGIDRAG